MALVDGTLALFNDGQVLALGLGPDVVLVEPARMGLVHLLHGVLDGAVEGIGLVVVAGFNGKVPGGCEDGSTREHSLVCKFLGSNYRSVVDASDGLEMTVSKESAAIGFKALTLPAKMAAARIIVMNETCMMTGVVD